MARIAIVLISAANATLFLFMSAISRQGGFTRFHFWPDGLGFLVIGACLVAALVLHSRKKSGAVALSVLALPIAFGAIELGEGRARQARLEEPDRPEFTAACKDAGPRFFEAPRAPVASVAFDWRVSADPPGTTYFEIDYHRNIRATGARGQHLQRASGLNFVERRRWEPGVSTDDAADYERIHSERSREIVTEITADALVFYEVDSHVANAGEGPFNSVTLTVTDRRDGRQLGRMLYVWDNQEGRACGETAPGVIDETAFIVRAISANR